MLRCRGTGQALRGACDVLMCKSAVMLTEITVSRTKRATILPMETSEELVPERLEQDIGRLFHRRIKIQEISNP